MAYAKYTKQFKDEAMRLVTERQYTATHAARELGMPINTLNKWLKDAGWRKPAKTIPAPPNATAALPDDPAVLKIRLQELEEENRRLRMEKDILKKATAYFAREQT